MSTAASAASPFVRSNYERRDSDHYPTIDGRCVEGLLATWPLEGLLVDCCAPTGSGIVDSLLELGLEACCVPEAAAVPRCGWIVTNPPYDRRIVDKIAKQIVAQVHTGMADGAAMLMREAWDMAAGADRVALFADPLYRGQTHMRFRPWWTESREKRPIHHFVWHIWAAGVGEPVVRFWKPAKGGAAGVALPPPRGRIGQ